MAQWVWLIGVIMSNNSQDTLFEALIEGLLIL